MLYDKGQFYDPYLLSCGTMNSFHNVIDDFNYELDELLSEDFNIDFRHGEPMTSNEIQNSITKQIPVKTRLSANWARNTFNSWIKERNKRILESNSTDLLLLSDDGEATLEVMTKGTLNDALQFFFFEARKRNGDRYPSDSLRCLFSGISCYLSNFLNKSWNLWKSTEFSGARRALDSAMKETSE